MFRLILPSFEGPFDLLLYFIKRDQIDIYDIPIAHITDEFLNFLKLMDDLDIEIASEFIFMASLLMEIKAKMLLPKNDTQQNETIEDPRTELVDMLIEYKFFKEISKLLNEYLESNKYFFPKGMSELELKEVRNKFQQIKPLGINELVKAYLGILKNKGLESAEIKIQPLNIDDEINRIRDVIRKKKQVKFSNLVQEKSKKYIILCFIALLELCKNREILVYQNPETEEIIVFSTIYGKN